MLLSWSYATHPRGRWVHTWPVVWHLAIRAILINEHTWPVCRWPRPSQNAGVSLRIHRHEPTDTKCYTLHAHASDHSTHSVELLRATPDRLASAMQGKITTTGCWVPLSVMTRTRPARLSVGASSMATRVFSSTVVDALCVTAEERPLVPYRPISSPRRLAAYPGAACACTPECLPACVYTCKLKMPGGGNLDADESAVILGPRTPRCAECPCARTRAYVRAASVYSYMRTR